MKIKAPDEPILLSERSYKWLRDLMRKNERRTRLNSVEKELVAGSECFYEQLKSNL
ncbi:MAG: hypothetical protein WC604_01385 [Candidatus Gracilibacteria bacterium]